MKKYIFNLYPRREKQPESVFELAMLIALYNQEQPEFDFINWVTNNMSAKHFVFHPIVMASDGQAASWYVQFYDESKHAGTIEVAIM